MHKTHFWPKKQCKKKIFFFTDLPTLFFFQTVTGNKPYFFLGLITLFHYFYCFSRYLSFHIAYYNENKVLVTHPLSTAEHYLKSNFLLDLLSCFPFEIFAYAAVPNFSGRNFVQGSTLRVNLWPQASKNSQKQLRASKKRPQMVLQGQ